MNKVQLLGRLVREPEVKSAGETTICNYTLAVPKRFKKKDGEQADFINCLCFGKSADFVSKYFEKGRQVAVVGSIQTRSWTDKEGNKRWSTEVVTDEHYFADSKKDGVETPKSEKGFYPVNDGADDGDLPF